MEMNELYICLFAFILAVIELGFYTVRVAMSVKGNRLAVSAIAIINNICCVLCMGIVFTGFTEYPYRALAYALGCTVGSYLGIEINRKMAAGTSFISLIADTEDSKIIKEALQKGNFDYTVIKGRGKDKDRELFKIPTFSTRKIDILKIVHDCAPGTMVIDEVIHTQNKLS